MVTRAEALTVAWSAMRSWRHAPVERPVFDKASIEYLEALI